MANVSVGAVALDLVLNQNNFNKDLSKVANTAQNMFGKLKKVAIGAFSVVAIRNFTKSCIDAYQSQIESERKLLEVMRMRESATKNDIKDIFNLASAEQKYGVVSQSIQLAGAQELSTYIEKADSIKKLIPQMNNMIAQQYGYNATQQEAVNIATMMGKVLEGQTGALSRYGYYFDENQEKILKFGKEEEKVAVLTEIIHDSIGDVNKALGDTAIGRQIQLANAWADVKAQMGYVAAQLKQVLIPVFYVLVNILAKAVGFMRQFMQALGITAKAQSTSNVALAAGSNAAGSYASSLDKAAKNAKKLNKEQGKMDELNIISSNKSSGSDGSSDLGGSGIGGGGFNNIDYNIGIDGDVEVSNKIQAIAEMASNAFKNVFQPFKNAWDTYGSAVVDSFKERWRSFLSISKEIYKSFENVWSNGTGEKFIGNILKIAITLNTLISNIRNSIVEVLENTGLGESIIQTIFDILNNVFEIVGQIGTYFQEIAVSDAFKESIKYIGEIIDILLQNVSNFSDVVKNWVMSEGFQNALNVVVKIVSDILKYAKEYAKFFVEMYEKYLYPVLSNVFDLISDVIVLIGDVWTAVQPVVSKIWDIFKATIEPIFSNIMNGINFVIEGLKGIIQFLSGVFTGDWDKAWGGIKKTVSSVWDFIKGLFSSGGKIFDGIIGALSTVFKTIVNSIISGINKVIATPFNTVNGLLNKIRNVSILGVEPFKKFWKQNPLPVPQIPKLAEGGYVNARNPQLAIIGDNTKEGEIVSPESKIYEQASKAIRDNKGGKQEIEITIYHKYEDGRTLIQKINQAQIDAGETLLLA